jgi:hypothetical protein
MTLTLQPTRVATEADEEGMLVFADDRLVAVLVHSLTRTRSLRATGIWRLASGRGSTA